MSEETKKPFVLIEFDPASNEMEWRMGGQLPIDKLVGTMELIKSMILDEQKRQMALRAQAESTKTIVVPGVNGMPRFKI